MNGVDYLIIVVLAFSVGLGAVRGFVSEAVAVLAWLGGLWLAWRYAPLLEPYMGGLLGNPPVRTWAARVLIVMAVVIVGWLVSGLLRYVLRHSGLSPLVDRLLGMLFGVVRGIVVLSACVLLAQFARLDQAKWWSKSRLLPYAVESASWIQTFAESGMTLLEKQARSPNHFLPAAAPRV